VPRDGTHSPPYARYRLGRTLPAGEDYTVYHARRWSAGAEPGRVTANDAITADRHAVAALLLAEPGADGLSSQSGESALSACLSYSEGDAAVSD